MRFSYICMRFGGSGGPSGGSPVEWLEPNLGVGQTPSSNSGLFIPRAPGTLLEL
jgi:hypothetical protein